MVFVEELMKMGCCEMFGGCGVEKLVWWMRDGEAAGWVLMCGGLGG
jgi:hypothetical protein